MSSIKIALPVSILTISTPCRCVVAFSILEYYLVNSCLGFSYLCILSLATYIFRTCIFSRPNRKWLIIKLKLIATAHRTACCLLYVLIVIHRCLWMTGWTKSLSHFCSLAIVLGQWPVTSETFSLRKVSFEYRDAPAPAYFQFLFIVLLACMLLFQNPFVRYMYASQIADAFFFQLAVHGEDMYWCQGLKHGVVDRLHASQLA